MGNNNKAVSSFLARQIVEISPKWELGIIRLKLSDENRAGGREKMTEGKKKISGSSGTNQRRHEEEVCLDRTLGSARVRSHVYILHQPGAKAHFSQGN